MQKVEWLEWIAVGVSKKKPRGVEMKDKWFEKWPKKILNR